MIFPFGSLLKYNNLHDRHDFNETPNHYIFSAGTNNLDLVLYLNKKKWFKVCFAKDIILHVHIMYIHEIA